MDRNHLANLIPFVLQEEQTHLNEEIKEQAGVCYCRWNDDTWSGYGDSVTLCPGLAATAKIGQASHAG